MRYPIIHLKGNDIEVALTHANQYGEEEGSNGEAYFDYTGYQPINSPEENVDIDRWQPKYFSDGEGGKFAPGCLTPFWDKVKPIALKSGDQFRPGPPPKVGSEQMAKEVQEEEIGVLKVTKS